MQNMLNSFEKFNEAALASAKTLNDINFRTFERFASEQLEAAADYMTAGTRQLEMLSAAKDVKAVAEQQSKLAAEYGEKFLGRARKATEILADTRAEYAAWAQESWKSATAAAPAAPKAAAKKTA